MPLLSGDKSGKIGGHVSEVDGLRALAVLAIVIYHLNSIWLPGGFVGVDIFYVISGFVVALSTSKHSSKNFLDFFSSFYKRRILRIYPAALFFIIVTALLSVLLIPDGYASKSIPKVGVASIFGVSNIVLFSTLKDYFGTATPFNPYTHTWSLGVEEQYYLIFPIFAFILISRTGDRKSKAPMLWALVAFTVLSLVACAYETYRNSSFAFFMMPTRFWELGAGFLTFLALQRKYPTGWLKQRSPTWLTIAFGPLSISILLISIIFASEKNFPFPWAVPVVLGTIGVIICAALGYSSVITKILGNEVAVFIGKISYSLYLWHWPVIVLLRWTVGIDTLFLQGIAGILIVTLTLISYFIIEKLPKTLSSLSAASPRIFYPSAVGIIGVAALVTGIIFWGKPHLTMTASANSGIWNPHSFPWREPANCQVSVKNMAVGDGEVITVAPQACIQGQLKDRHRLFVIGDSHAAAYERLLYRLAATDGTFVKIYTLSGCKPLDRFDSDIQRASSCPNFLTQSIGDIASHVVKGDVVFLPGLYTPRFRNFWDAPVVPTSSLDLTLNNGDISAAKAGFARIEPIVRAGARIILEAPKPVMKDALFRCADWFNRSNSYCRVPPGTKLDEMLLRRSRSLNYIRAVSAQSDQISIWDPLPALCPQNRCEGYVGQRPLYNDTDHLSAYGNDFLFPKFERYLTSTVDEAR